MAGARRPLWVDGGVYGSNGGWHLCRTTLERSWRFHATSIGKLRCAAFETSSISQPEFDANHNFYFDINGTFTNSQ